MVRGRRVMVEGGLYHVYNRFLPVARACFPIPLKRWSLPSCFVRSRSGTGLLFLPGPSSVPGVRQGKPGGRGRDDVNQ